MYRNGAVRTLSSSFEGLTATSVQRVIPGNLLRPVLNSSSSSSAGPRACTAQMLNVPAPNSAANTSDDSTRFRLDVSVRSMLALYEQLATKR